MLTCRKCHVAIIERIAQQSLSEIKATLGDYNSPINTYRKAMNFGPLCDACLEQWQESHRRKVSESSTVDLRSPAIRALDEACLRLVASERD